MNNNIGDFIFAANVRFQIMGGILAIILLLMYIALKKNRN